MVNMNLSKAYADDLIFITKERKIIKKSHLNT